MRLEKRELAAQISAGVGFTKCLEMLPKRRLLMVLYYHRIGDATQTPYDSGTFSATAEELDAQVTYLKRHFYITTLEEACAMASGDAQLTTSALITFDDGYIDNYTLAFPILRSHGVQGVFFLPTDFIGGKKLPWWDIIAYIVKHSQCKILHLGHPKTQTIDLERDGYPMAIMHILRLYKRLSIDEGDRFISSLEEHCECSRPNDCAERCFLNWDEARMMQQAGMAFGSHTHSHEILAKLSLERQQEELRLSREILESQLNQRIDTLAFPVGGRGSFSDETIELLRRTGYAAAFSKGGVNLSGRVNPFNILRNSISGQSHSRLRLQTSFAAVTGKWCL